MLAFFFVANYTLSFISIFGLRMKEPEMARPYRAWGYPWTPGLALASSILFLAGAAYTDRVNTPWALAMLVASYPIFRVMKLFSRRAARSFAIGPFPQSPSPAKRGAGSLCRPSSNPFPTY
jgi:amino acid transporter